MIDLTNGMVPQDERTILTRQTILFMSSVTHKRSGQCFGTRLAEESVLHPGSLGDLSQGAAFRKLEVELEDSSDEVIELHIQREANHELVESIAIMCDEPKGFNRLGCYLCFISPDAKFVRRIFL